MRHGSRTATERVSDLSGIAALLISTAVPWSCTSQISTDDATRRTVGDTTSETEQAAVDTAPPSIESISRLAAKPGETVEIRGTNLGTAVKVTLSGREVETHAMSSDVIAFTMPVLPAGTVNGEVLGETEVLKTFTLVSDSSPDDLPINLSDAKDVCSDTSFRDATGLVRTGTRNCNPTPTACVAGGSNCFLAAFDQSTQPLKAIAIATVTPGDIRRGVSIGGIQGEFPSSAYPLERYSSDSGSSTAVQAAGGITTDLTQFTTQMTADGSFEFWDETGVRHTGSGDAQILDANVKAGVNFENLSVSGSFSGSTSYPNAWDVRVGVDRGDGTMGKLKVNCRNAINNTYYNYDGTTAAITNAVETGGTTFDWWDSIEDYYGLPASSGFPASWSVAENYCGGTTTSDDDANVWRDTTTAGCSGAACRYRDKITKLQWSKVAATGRTWAQAVNDCATLSLDGVSGWRLPTQKELAAASAHGIASTASPDFIPSATMNTYFWSATSNSLGTSQAWATRLSDGNTSKIAKTTTSYNVVCVK